MKIKRFTDGNKEIGFNYWCPGCDMPHSIYIEQKNRIGAQWSWNGSIEAPTFSPSILCRTPGKNTTEVCHSFVKEGNIQFLGDCTHELAGKTVAIPEWPNSWD